MNRFVIRILYLIPAALAGCAAPLLSALTGAGAGSGAGTPGNSTAATIAGASTNVTPPSIFDQVEPSTRIALLSPSAILSENGQIDLVIIAEQCRFNTPDPPFLVPSLDPAQKGWVFAGRLNDSGHSREMQAMEYRSFFGLGWGKQQLSTWPVSMTTLGEMSNLYLDQRVGMLAASKLEKKEQDRLSRQYIDESSRIADKVARLQRTYDPGQQCIKKE